MDPARKIRRGDILQLGQKSRELAELRSSFVVVKTVIPHDRRRAIISVIPVRHIEEARIPSETSRRIYFARDSETCTDSDTHIIFHRAGPDSQGKVRGTIRTHLVQELQGDQAGRALIAENISKKIAERKPEHAPDFVPIFEDLFWKTLKNAGNAAGKAVLKDAISNVFSHEVLEELGPLVGFLTAILA